MDDDEKVCGSYCDGFCGLDWEGEEQRPSLCDDYDLCLGDGIDEECDEFYSENE